MTPACYGHANAHVLGLNGFFFKKSAIFQSLKISEINDIIAIKNMPSDKEPMMYLPQKFGIFSFDLKSYA